MSTHDAPQTDASNMTISVMKSDVPDYLTPRQPIGLDGEFLWPIDPIILARFYQSSAEHGRAIQIKAESAFGGGLIGDVAAIEALCDTGTAELFVLLGLDLEAYGNAFLQQITSADGRVVGIRRLPAKSMARCQAGFLQRITMPDGETRKITFAADEIIHLREPCPMGGYYALPTWIGAEGMMDLAISATRYNQAFFQNNAIPEYAVIFKGTTPSEAQKQAIQQFFRAEMRGADKAHRTLVVSHPEDGEISFEKLTADVKDADFLKLHDAVRDRMPVAHGVPSRMLGIMTAGQLGGSGEVSAQLFIFEHLTLKPRRRRVLDQLRPFLASLGLRPSSNDQAPADGEVAFRPLDLTPPKDDTEDLPMLVQAGILTPDEARALLPMLGGASESGAGGTPAAIERRAPQSPVDALAALLAQS